MPASRPPRRAAITSGDVPDVVTPAFGPYDAAEAWTGKLEDVSDIIEPLKSAMAETVLSNVHLYNNVTKERSYYALPWAGTLTPFHIWGSLIANRL